MDMKELGDEILMNLKQEFDITFLSGNLRDTLKITPTDKGIQIEIPAQRYDLKKWNKENVIVYTEEGSYAQVVDEYGGFSKKHKDYVEKAILKAIANVLRKHNERGEITVI